MSSFFSWFSKVYDFFSRRRKVLYLVVLVIVALCGFFLKNFNLREDLQPLLPAGRSRAAEDFRLLSQSPFLQKVLLTLEAQETMDLPALLQAADTLAQALSGPYFHRVQTGPGASSPEEFFSFLLQMTPMLFTEADRQKVSDHLTPEGIRSQLLNLRDRLSGPEGWVMKKIWQEDPLELHRLALEKWGRMNFFSGLAMREGHFVSTDGRQALLVADTPIAVTDSAGSEKLVEFVQAVIRSQVPPGIRVSLLSGHVYTAANARVIRQDLVLILSSVAVLILALLFLFLQNWRAILVFLVPSSVILIATAAIVTLYRGISAVTIAFGSVLMGIADDYPIFTFFSLRNQGRFTGEAVARTARPVLFSGLTTLAAFSALFFSDLPGQRQIALFSLFGIVASLAFSLLILPHFLQGMPPARLALNPRIPLRDRRPYRGWILGLWVAVLSLGVWQGTKIIFNGDMQALNWVPAELRQTEEAFKKTFGDFREKAMIFVEGKDLETALQNNERLFILLTEKVPVQEIISVAPFFPSRRLQEQNMKRWSEWWSGGQRERVLDLIRREGDRAGFSPKAFMPFAERLREKPRPILWEREGGKDWERLRDAFIIRQQDKVLILTLVTDSEKTAALFSGDSAWPFPVRWISPQGFNRNIGRAMVHNFLRYILTANLIILVLVVLLFRKASKVLAAMIPVLTGLVVMFGMMGFTGIEFNLFNIIATILVIGLSVDLGIFMVTRISEGFEAETGTAVLLSGLTSLVGMGALILARHPALFSMGITVLLGMCGAIPAALWVVPALSPFQKGEERG